MTPARRITTNEELEPLAPGSILAVEYLREDNNHRTAAVKRVTGDWAIIDPTNLTVSLVMKFWLEDPNFTFLLVHTPEEQ